MTIKIAINRFGRDGRGVLRATIKRGPGDSGDPEYIAHPLKFDSLHGRCPTPVLIDGDMLCVGGRNIRLTAVRDPQDLRQNDVSIVFECTGLFTDRPAIARLPKSRAKRVLNSAPKKTADKTVDRGAIHPRLTCHNLIAANTFCSTARSVPVLDGFIAESTTMLPVFTSDQPSHDTSHPDPHRARAALLSRIPTSTGAAKVISLVLPQLADKQDGSAIRVTGSNAAMATAAGPLSGVMSHGQAPMDLADFHHDPQSTRLAAAQTTVTAFGMGRVVSWFDHERGTPNQMINATTHRGHFMHDVGATRLARRAGHGIAREWPSVTTPKPSPHGHIISCAHGAKPS